MLTSLSYIFILGIILGSIFNKLKLPKLLGMLITGIILGPYALNLLDDSILGVSAELRQFALIIILIRAGLSLDINDLKKVGRPAILMCFVPACFEIVGMIVIAPKLLGISILDAAIMGAVVGAVSPAVIVPKMLHLMKNRYGTNKSIPQMILAGASVDDVFVIVMFTAFTGLAKGESITLTSFMQIPISITTGLLYGLIMGIVISLIFEKIQMRNTMKVIILLSISFLLVAIEKNSIIPFSGLLAVMSMGATIYKKNIETARHLSSKFSKLWLAAELLLFALVGATVDINYALSSGFSVVIVIFASLVFRMFGVLLCMVKTKLSMKEIVFCMIAYIPKATVQAAIGSIPLAMGLPCGNIVLTVAVLAILITAPLGAFAIELTYDKLLIKEEV